VRLSSTIVEQVGVAPGGPKVSPISAPLLYFDASFVSEVERTHGGERNVGIDNLHP